MLAEHLVRPDWSTETSFMLPKDLGRSSRQLYTSVVKAARICKQFQQYFRNQRGAFLRTRIMENVFWFILKIKSSLVPSCFRDGSWYLAGGWPHVKNVPFSWLLTTAHFEKVINLCDSSANMCSIKTCQSLVPMLAGNAICGKHICCPSCSTETKSPAAAACDWWRLCGTWHQGREQQGPSNSTGITCVPSPGAITETGQELENSQELWGDGREEWKRAALRMKTGAMGRRPTHSDDGKDNEFGSFRCFQKRLKCWKTDFPKEK